MAYSGGATRRMHARDTGLLAPIPRSPGRSPAAPWTLPASLDRNKPENEFIASHLFLPSENRRPSPSNRPGAHKSWFETTAIACLQLEMAASSAAIDMRPQAPLQKVSSVQ